MSTFSTVRLSIPAGDCLWRHYTPGTLLRINDATYRIVGSCRGRGRLLLRRLG